jgi:tetratricopeptide (TPR) repeat protein
MAQMRLNSNGELETLSPADWLALRARLRIALRASATLGTPYTRILQQYVPEAPYQAPETEPRHRETPSTRTNPKNNEEAGRSIVSLIQQLTEDGKLSEAEPLAREALAKARRSYTNTSIRLVTPLFQLADILYRQGRYAEAETLYREDLQLRRSAYVADNEEVIRAAASLGRLLADWAWSDRSRAKDIRNLHERAHEAEKLLRECWDIRNRTLTNGWRLPDTQSRLGFAILAVVVSDLGLPLEMRLSKIEEAQTFLLRGLDGLEKGDERPVKYRRYALERLVRLYEAWDELAPNTGKANQAAEWKRKLVELDP